MIVGWIQLDNAIASKTKLTAIAIASICVGHRKYLRSRSQLVAFFGAKTALAIAQNHIPRREA